MPDPMERLGPWFIKDVSPEAELLFREVNRAAAFAASCLASTWLKRTTAEWIDPEENKEALIAVVDLERHGELGSVELESLPLLPEVPPNYEPGRTWTGEFADLRTLLPLADDELIALRDGLTAWNRSETGARPEIADPELLVRWQDWLREPPDEDGILRVRPDALAVHTLCSRLYHASKLALGK